MIVVRKIRDLPIRVTIRKIRDLLIQAMIRKIRALLIQATIRRKMKTSFHAFLTVQNKILGENVNESEK